MAPDFASEEDLLDRLTAQPEGIVFLVGSAVTAPGRAGEPGVPRVDGVIEQIRRVYTRPDALARLEQALAAAPQQRYQAAFRHLQRTRGQDSANAIIRRCVLQARVPSRRFPEVHQDIAEGASELCRSLEHDLDGWHLPPAVEALGRLLASIPAGARPVVLTSNFDPLVAVSVHRAGGRAFTTALNGDGGFAAIDGQGTLIVHFHGDWFRSDTLHTPAQLGQDRPRLAASLAQLLGARTLVVLGYGGWDDIFTRSLVQVIRGELAAIDVLWTFYSADPARLAEDHAGLLANLGPGIERARVLLYKGIDAHTFLPRLARALGIAESDPQPETVSAVGQAETRDRTGDAKPQSSAAPVLGGHEFGSPGERILGRVIEDGSAADSGAHGVASGSVPGMHVSGARNPARPQLERSPTATISAHRHHPSPRGMDKHGVQHSSEVSERSVMSNSRAPGDTVLATWIHISDLHFGHGDASHQWNQQRVLDELLVDARGLVERGVVPRPGFAFVTGDIAFSGGARTPAAGETEYALASRWLRQLRATLDIPSAQLFVVPGNHDVDRNADADVKRLLRGLRVGDESIDEVLREPRDLARLRCRMASYLTFAQELGAAGHEDFHGGLWWRTRVPLAEGVSLRICGLNTALLSLDEHDQGRLRVGQRQLAELFVPAPEPLELAVVLGHHPVNGHWLADEKDVRGQLDRHAAIHLFGHLHEADSEQVRHGGGTGCLRIAAGAAHGEAGLVDAPPVGHGYNFGALVVLESGDLAVRIWPRRWSTKAPRFVADVDNTLEDSDHSEHRLPGKYRVHRAPPKVGLYPGRVICGRYRLEAALGQGGVGQVWRTHDVESGETVALKVLNHDGAEPDPGRRAAFYRGAQAMAVLQHPAIARVRDPQPNPDRRHGPYDFYVMDFIDAPNLGDALKGKPRSDAETIALMLAIGEGVAAAHRQHVIHRDLKPSNILHDPASGRVVIIDFDTARDLSNLTMTRSGEGLASAYYTSPEVMAALNPPPGGAPKADGRADIFSLAVIGVFLRTGRNPSDFHIAEVIAEIECAPGLREVLAKGCARQVGQRYPSMDAMMAALRRTQAHSDGREPANAPAEGPTTTPSAPTPTAPAPTTAAPALTTSPSTTSPSTTHVPSAPTAPALPRGPGTARGSRSIQGRNINGDSLGSVSGTPASTSKQTDIDSFTRSRIEEAIVAVEDELNKAGYLGTTVTAAAVAEESGVTADQVRSIFTELVDAKVARGPIHGDDILLNDSFKKWRKRRSEVVFPKNPNQLPKGPASTGHEPPPPPTLEEAMTRVQKSLNGLLNPTGPDRRDVAEVTICDEDSMRQWPDQTDRILMHIMEELRQSEWTVRQVGKGRLQITSARLRITVP